MTMVKTSGKRYPVGSKVYCRFARFEYSDDADKGGKLIYCTNVPGIIVSDVEPVRNYYHVAFLDGTSKSIHKTLISKERTNDENR